MVDYCFTILKDQFAHTQDKGTKREKYILFYNIINKTHEHNYK